MGIASPETIVTFPIHLIMEENKVSSSKLFY